MEKNNHIKTVACFPVIGSYLENYLRLGRTKLYTLSCKPDGILILTELLTGSYSFL